MMNEPQNAPRKRLPLIPHLYVALAVFAVTFGYYIFLSADSPKLPFVEKLVTGAVTWVGVGIYEGFRRIDEARRRREETRE
jgi:hypothetical protein